MNEKDKAIDLVDKYRMVLMNEDTDCGEEILCTIISQKCAIIAVNEIINEAKRWNSSYMGNKRYCELLKVKEEILKL